MLGTSRWSLPAVVAVAVVLTISLPAGALCPPGWTCECQVQTPYPPTGAPWGVVNNGSFESGFTSGVGNNWTAAYGSFASTPTYSDSTLRATQGTHSQRIDIPEPATGLMDQKAGVYQQVYVVPGQTYTLTADVYMELDGSEQYSGQNMVAAAGLDAWGDTHIGEGSIKWSSLQGDKNAWRTLQVSTQAVFEVMTVYVVGWRKYVDMDNGRIWIDNVVLSGPVPTQPPSPPEQEPPDPDADIPDTVGSERVNNGSFEGSWSSGLASGWTSWSAAGTGYWKQSTLVGKVGAGKYDYGEADTVVAMNPKTALTMQMGDADYWGTKPNMVDTVIVGRLYIDPLANQYLSDPEYYGPVHANNCYTEQRNHPRIDCWQGFCEPGWGDPDNWDRVLRFEKAFALRCHELGMKAVVMNMSVGSPGNIWLMLDAEDLLAVGDYVGYHSYGGPNDQLMVNAASPVDDDPCCYSLRWRKYADMYRDRGWRMPPTIYTEGTTYNGWHGVFSPEQIRDDLIAFGGYMNENRWCTGLTLFVAGGTGDWVAFDIRGQGNIASACGTWNAAHPSEAIDGLYSQQFGAGNVHPTTTTEMDNPNAAFTGGICQQVTGLVASSTYLLDLDFRYEFRGLQPQAKFYTGIDQTGQTSNPSAASINWTTDLVVDEPALHEIWERTWRTFVASGSTVSIWLKAEQTVANPAYRISVDRVSLKQVDGGATTPLISLSPTSLSPSCAQGTNATSQTFTVTNTGIGTLSYSITDNVTWLSCTPTSGTSTGEADTITVNYTTSSLTAGTYNATITVSDPAAGNNPQTVAVTLTVSPPAVSVVEDFESMPSWSSSFDASWGSAATWSIVAGGQVGNALQTARSAQGSSVKAKVCTITAGASYTISLYIKCPSFGGAYWAESAYKLGSYTAQDFDENAGTWTLIQKFANDGTNGNGNTWVKYSKTFSSGSNTQVSVGFKLGSYGGAGPTVLWDTLRIVPSGATPTINRSPATLSPSCTQGSNASNQTFTVSNSGTGVLDYTISDNVTWLSCSPAAGSSTGEADTITVTYATSGLTAGTYNGTITISDANATNNPQTIAVTLTVNPPPPTINRSPATLAPSCTQGSNASNQTFTVQNSGGGTLSYSITDNVTWLACSPTSGTSTGETDTITVTYTTSSLSAGTYNGTITITDPNATNNPQTIAVTLTVNPSKITVAEDFTSMPSWSSSFDASWGGAATWSIVSGGQAGNCLQATRSNTGSSTKAKVYTITAGASYTISVYMRCPSSSASYWRECAFKLGSYTAQDFDQNGGTWTMIQKFSNTGTNGNGDTWVQYTVNFSSGSATQISVGYKTGNSSGTAPTIKWDTLRIQ